MEDTAEYNIDDIENLIEDMHSVFHNYAILLSEFRSHWVAAHFVSDQDEDKCLDKINDAETCRETLYRGITSLSDFLGVDESVFEVIQIRSRDDLDEWLRDKLYARAAEKSSNA